MWQRLSGAIAMVLVSANAFAQADIGFSATALVSLQPVDDSYVGSPYLSEGIGGIGPGFGAGLSVIARHGFIVSGEYTRARFRQEQDGRLVLGPFPLEHVSATTQLQDSMVSILAGYARGASTRLVLLGGVSLRLDRPTINEVEAEAYDNGEGILPAFTGGVDILRPLSPRTQLVVSGRYTFNERDTRQQYLGIGPHIIRAGVGVRVRVH